ncbi:MAG: hypothetical protein DCC75_08800 [Proteobacteria bacterium]|nr:MAG: hypothetical protein DCC75_08800 [Pseudomonadota bacterium]
MKLILKFMLLGLTFSLTFSENVKAEKVCLKLQLSRGRIKQAVQTVPTSDKCPKGFKEILNTNLVVGAQGSVGPQGPQGPAGVSDIRIADSAVNGGLGGCLITNPVPPFNCLLPSISVRTATCPAETLVVKSWCVEKPNDSDTLPGVIPSESTDGTSASCVYVTSSVRAGSFFARVACLPLPPL